MKNIMLGVGCSTTAQYGAHGLGQSTCAPLRPPCTATTASCAALRPPPCLPARRPRHYRFISSYFIVAQNQNQTNLKQQFNSIQFNSIQFNSIQFNSIQFTVVAVVIVQEGGEQRRCRALTRCNAVVAVVAAVIVQEGGEQRRCRALTRCNAVVAVVAAVSVQEGGEQRSQRCHDVFSQ